MFPKKVKKNKDVNNVNVMQATIIYRSLNENVLILHKVKLKVSIIIIVFM